MPPAVSAVFDASAPTDALPPARRPSWSRPLAQLLRRAHLYAGLMMLPWVFLYGVTGLLFNHPTWFPDRTLLNFGPDETAATPLADLPTAAELAAEVVAAVGRDDGVTYRIVRANEARFEKGAMTAAVTANGRGFDVSFDPTAGAGTVRETVAPAATVAKPEAPPVKPNQTDRPQRPADLDVFSADGIAAGRFSLERFQSGLPAVLDRLGLGPATVGKTKLAPLTFFAEADGRVWKLSYDAAAATVSGRPADAVAAGSELSTRRFLTRMHLTHGYPADGNRAKFLWAVVVDMMASVMIFWGASGIVMWWQLKRTRRLGAAVLLASAATAATLVPLMHGMIAAGP